MLIIGVGVWGFSILIKHLVIGQRLNQDVTDYPNQHKRLYRNNGEWNLVDMADILVLRESTQE